MNQFLSKYMKQMIEEFKPYNEIKRMTYEDGLMLIAAMRYYEVTSEEYVLRFLINYLDAFIDEDGNIQSYQLEDYNIDNILAGNVLFFVFEQTKNGKYQKAIELLRSQLLTHPRTLSGSFWHKKRYPFQIWLDGLYMGQVFYLRYGLINKDRFIIEDVINQVDNADKLLWDKDRELYVHAYDETLSMQWADKNTGHSPNIWSRSVGWFAMALVDLFELFGKSYQEEQEKLKAYANKLIKGLIRHLDNDYKMLYQIVDKPLCDGNYLETSGSAMIAYTLIKGYRLNLFDEVGLKLGKSLINGINRKYLREESNQIILGGICAVAGLDNEKRDGSVEYYLSEKVAENEIKGVGPYLFALIELEKK